MAERLFQNIRKSTRWELLQLEGDAEGCIGGTSFHGLSTDPFNCESGIIDLTDSACCEVQITANRPAH
jgi:hypothetical protein